MAIQIVLALLALLVVFLIYVALKPAEFMISRELEIKAPAEKIFPFLNNSRLMNEWNPWSELDPQAKMSFSGPEQGVGAKTSWEAGKRLGTGCATIVESVPDQRVGTKLEYVKPFPMKQDAEIKILPSANGTSTVVWSVRGKNSFMGRLMCSFVNMDKMVGSTFEKGLGNLKMRIAK